MTTGPSKLHFLIRTTSVFFVLASLCLAGCQTQDPDDDIITDSKTLHASIEVPHAGQPGISYGRTHWKKGDLVSVFHGTSENVQYKVSDKSDGRDMADLVRTKKSDGSFMDKIDANIAIYPYSSSHNISKSRGTYEVKNVEIPDTQMYDQVIKGEGAFPMAAAAESSSDELEFMNVLGFLELDLRGEAAVRSITVIGNRDEILCGPATVTVPLSDAPSIYMSDKSSTAVVLDCGEGVRLSPDRTTPFVIAVPPVKFPEGFTVTIEDTDGNRMETVFYEARTITRSQTTALPAMTYDGGKNEDVSENPFTLTALETTTVSINSELVDLRYRKGKEEWSEYRSGSTIGLLAGEHVQFIAAGSGNRSFSSSFRYSKVEVTGNGGISASGNIMSLVDCSTGHVELDSFAFAGLFHQCKKLVDASGLILPLLSVPYYCYQEMFAGCTELVSAPNLPAVELSNGCYKKMFDGCRSLIKAPELSAGTVVYQCYREMFNDCTSLTVAPRLPAMNLDTYCYVGMFRNCSSLVEAPELPATVVEGDCYVNMFTGCSSLISAPALPAMTAEVYCYYEMFSGCTALTTAPALPATTVMEGCYKSMFEGCTSLVTAPQLPATSVDESCYERMFARCSSLISAPELPAKIVSDSSYEGMFLGCTSLTAVPELPATTLGKRCYCKMFEGCTSLESATVTLPSTTLPPECYRRMFCDCSCLTSAPCISGTFLSEKCCYEMFSSCKSLRSAPELPATEMAEGCYSRMFDYCTSLMTAPELPATRLAAGCYEEMFENCTSLMTAPELPATTLAAGCYEEMFRYCKSLKSAPELPATEMAEGCYSGMFEFCESLESAPELPAISLAKWCYCRMFYCCSSLRYVKALFTDENPYDQLEYWLFKVNASGTFVKNKNAKWKSIGIPDGWTVEEC